MFRNKIKKSAIICVCFVFLGQISRYSYAQSPWHNQDRFKQQSLHDPDRFTRSRTDPLKKSDIKNHQKNIKSAQILIFRDAGRPNRAVLQVGNTDPSSGQTPVEAQARLNDFSDSIKSQIFNQLGNSPSGNLNSKNPVIGLKLVLTGDNSAKVLSAKEQGSFNFPKQNAIPTLAQQPNINLNLPHQNQANNPRLTQPQIQNPQQRGTQRQPDQTLFSNQGNPGPSQIQNQQQGLPPPNSDQGLNQPQTLRTETLTRSEVDPVLARTADRLASALGTPSEQIQYVSSPQNPAQQNAIAILPLTGGEAITINAVTPLENNTVQVELQGSLENFPSSIQNQIGPSLNAGAVDPNSNPDVQVTVNLQSDNTIQVAQVKLSPALNVNPTQNSNTQTNAPVVQANQINPSQNQAQQNQNIENPQISRSEFQSLKSVLEFIGPVNPLSDEQVQIIADPQNVTPTQDPTPIALFQPEGGSVTQVFEVGSDPQSGETTFRAEAVFGDLSAHLKNHINDVLSQFGGSEILEDNSQVEVDITKNQQQEITLIAVKIKTPLSPDKAQKETIILWRQGPVDSAKKDKSLTTSKFLSLARLAIPFMNVANLRTPDIKLKNPSLKNSEGLLPSLTQVIDKILGVDPDQIEAKWKEGEPSILLLRSKINSRTLPNIELSAQLTAGRHSYFIEADPLKFSEDIQDQIDALLEEAALRGESWVKSILKSKEKVTLELETHKNPETGKIEVSVVGVTPAMTAFIEGFIENLGIDPGSFDLIMDNAKALIQLHAGLSLKGPEKDKPSLTLTSKEGGLFILVTRKNMKKKGQIQLVLSRRALSDNKQALDTFLGQNEGPQALSVTRLLSDNPNSQEFLLQLNQTNPNKSTGTALLIGLIKEKKPARFAPADPLKQKKIP